ncbi:hypothetical protein ACIPEN_14410 [Herbaspirillum chlorophenolicum]|uniref:Transmembrane protein n=1 Tax=Herbaspirillum chlorophenolicum TaxID=211589 RepID=A0ABW8F158_9BURK
MKLYYRREPTRKLVHAAFWIRNKAMFLKWPIAVLLAAAWVIVIPPCWLIIKASNFCHDAVGFCGFDSRDW